MKIAVIIATRGRPERAAAVIQCARNFMSGQVAVDFVVALDADDQRSIDFFSKRIAEDVVAYVAPRPDGVGDVWNRAAAKFQADIYIAVPDDAWIIGPHWDLVSVNVLKDEGGLPAQLGVVGWFDPANPGVTSIFSMSAKWVEMIGHIFDPRYPFWYGDTALVETAIFATGMGMPQVDLLKFASMPGKFNPRLRDMDLWWDFFAATRLERVETARKVAALSGMPTISPAMMAKLVKACEARDAQGRAQISDVMQTIENPASPSQEYWRAKAAAEEYLRRAAIPAGQSRSTGEPQGPHP